MKNIPFALFFLFSFALTAQNFNEYKYIVVPKTFSIFNTVDKYRTSALTKFLFDKKGYTVVYDDALPEDLKVNSCLGLKTNLRKESNMFTTKIRIVFLDCNNKEVFVSEQGKSKEKEFVKSYSEAIRDAFKSFEGISYNYKPKKSKKDDASVVLNFKGDVKEVNKETVVKSLEKDAKEKKPMRDEAVEEKEVKQTISKATPVTIKNDASTLYAQEITNGFQLVDSTPKILFKIYKTSAQGYFIAEKGNINGIVINKNGSWFFEYYENNQLKSEELKIKF